MLSPHSLATQTHLADQHVRLVKVAAKQFGRLSGNVLDFDAHLLALACGIHLLVVALDGRHNTQVHELQGRGKDTLFYRHLNNLHRRLLISN